MLTIMANRTTSHDFSLLGQRLQTEIAYRMHLSSLGALSQTCKTMNAIAKLPLCYVNFQVEAKGKSPRARLPEPPEFSELPDWTKRHLDKFVLRLVVIERFPELNPLERPRPERPVPKRHHRSASQPLPIAPNFESKQTLAAIREEARPNSASRQDVFKRLKHGASKEDILLETKTMPPLAALNMLSTNFELLLGDMGEESAQALSEALQRIPMPTQDGADFSATVDAHLALLRAAHHHFCGRKKKAGVSSFTTTLFAAFKNFVLHSSLQKAHLADTPKFHLLIGELLRSFAYAKNWDRTKTEAYFKDYFIAVGALTREQWADVLAVAISQRDHPKWSYQHLLQRLQIEESVNPGKSKSKHGRRASMSAIAPMPKSDDGCVELEVPQETSVEQGDIKPPKEDRAPRKDGRNDDENEKGKGERKGRENCILS